MRQFIAIAIMLFALEYLMQRKYINFTSIIIIATLFHTSAISMLGLIILNEFKLRLVFAPFYIFILIVILLNLRSLMNFAAIFTEQFARYIGGRYDVKYEEAYGLKLLIPFVIFIFFILGKERIEINEYAISHSFISSMLLMYFVVQIFTLNVMFLSRFIFYFKIFIIISIPISLHKIYAKSFNELVIKHAIKVTILMFFFVDFYIALQGYNSNIVPYIFYFNT
jgi:transmembrane protein EpsG